MKIFYLNILFFTAINIICAQSKLKVEPILGFNFYNAELESEFYDSGYLNSKLYQRFFISPQIGFKLDLNERHHIRYLKSYQIIINREALPISADIIRVRSLDRLNYMYSFKNKNYLTLGFTYLLQKGEVLLSQRFGEKYVGNFGLNFGFGKESNMGYVEINNLLALEFGDMTPADLFGFWTVDFGYYLGKKTETEKNIAYNKTIFGIGIVGGLNFFNNRTNYPVFSLFELNYGIDMHVNFPYIKSSVYWRRMVGYHIVPIDPGSDQIFSVRWNQLGLRQRFSAFKNEFYGFGAFLFGFDAKQTYGHELGAANQISGVSLGLGFPMKHWAIELQADAYIDVPLPEIKTGFGWDRIKLSVIYNLPIITK